MTYLSKETIKDAWDRHIVTRKEPINDFASMYCFNDLIITESAVYAMLKEQFDKAEAIQKRSIRIHKNLPTYILDENGRREKVDLWRKR